MDPTPNPDEPVVDPVTPVVPPEPPAPEPVPDPTPAPVEDESVLDDFWICLHGNLDLGVITPAQFERLKVEVNTGHYTQFDLDELEAGRFKGRGFGVDYSTGAE